MNCFCRMVDWWKVFSLTSGCNHYQRFSPLLISDTLWAGFEPVPDPSPGFPEWSCAVVVTTIPRHQKTWCHNHCTMMVKHPTEKMLLKTLDYFLKEKKSPCWILGVVCFYSKQHIHTLIILKEHYRQNKAFNNYINNRGYIRYISIQYTTQTIKIVNLCSWFNENRCLTMPNARKGNQSTTKATATEVA